MKENNKLEPNKRSPKSRTLFKDTLTRALLENDSEKLRNLCDQIIFIALDGSLPLNDRLGFIKVVMDRVDGRPAQAIELTDNQVNLPNASQFKIVKVEPSDSCAGASPSNE